MGSVRQRRARKNTVHKATRRNKDSQRKVNVASNPIIAANWDYKLTLAQNYKKLGLTAKLGIAAGGQEANLETPVLKETLKQKQQQRADDKGELTAEQIPEGEARIIRDDEGNVVKVIYGTKTVLDDDFELTELPKVAPKTEVVRQLEEYAQSRQGTVERTQSTREEAWVEALYDKYGDDYEKMKWDKKLNIYQQSPGDLKRRVTKWKKKHNVV